MSVMPTSRSEEQVQRAGCPSVTSNWERGDRSLDIFRFRKVKLILAAIESKPRGGDRATRHPICFEVPVSVETRLRHDQIVCWNHECQLPS